jgi:hypothetical protein
VVKRVTILLTAQLQERMTMNIQTWYPKRISKKSSLKDMLTKKEKQSKKKENMEVDDESLEMNVFEKTLGGKHTEIVSNADDDLKRINDTNTSDYSEKNNMTDKPCLGNNCNNDYDE